ncbi:unnamed protein product, partial [Amoebophrya sp. A25]
EKLSAPALKDVSGGTTAIVQRRLSQSSRTLSVSPSSGKNHRTDELMTMDMRAPFTEDGEHRTGVDDESGPTTESSLLTANVAPTEASSTSPRNLSA